MSYPSCSPLSASSVGGGSWYKGHSENVLLKWITKSSTLYNNNNDPLLSAKAGINMCHVFKDFLKLVQN